MRVLLQGVDDRDALFNVNGTGVVVNTRNLTASVVPLEAEADSRFWVAPEPDAPVNAWAEVARCALAAPDTPDVSVQAAGSPAARAYTVPKAVSRTATEALDRLRYGARPDAPGSLHVAHVLAAGGQVALREVAHVARYFAANESRRGKVSWNLWGGDPGARWSQGVVDKVGLVATANPEVNLLAFYDGTPETRSFLALKGSEDFHNDEVVALYKRTPEAGWQLWFNGDWEPSTKPDAPTPLVELDDDTAVYVAGALFDAPDAPVSLRDRDPEEWDVNAAGLDGTDWEVVDQTLLSNKLGPRPVTAAAPADDYTPEERSKNASSQLRDANGRFAKVGDSGLMKQSGIRGKIQQVDPVRNQLIIAGDDGNAYMIDPKEFETDAENVPTDTPAQPAKPYDKLPPLNLDSILGQPRATSKTPKAMLKNLLPPMGPAQLKQVIDDYSGFIRQERLANADKFPGGTGWDETRKPTAKEARETRRLKHDIKAYEDKVKARSRPKGHVGEHAVEEDAPATPEKLNPDTSDVKPLHLALVDRDDPQAVTDLVALVPAASDSDQPTAYRRVAGAWVEDAKVLEDMRGPTPPPTVQLDDASYKDVLEQVDSHLEEPADDQTPEQPSQPSEPSQPTAPAAPVRAAAQVIYEPEVIPMWGPNEQLLMLITAAGEGGADRNRGNAEKLRRYWLHGPGAAKILWGTPGDWTRCYRLLSKYMGLRAKGYCALRHHEATGKWTGDKANLASYALFAGAALGTTADDLRSTAGVEAVSQARARVRSLKARVYGQGYEGSTDPADISYEGGGRRFRIPLVIPEGLESGDGRTFDVGALSMRNLPLPLMWQEKTGEGHNDSVVVGRIDRVERVEKGLGNATGVFDTGPWGQEAQRLVESGMLRWVSADLDRFKADEVTSYKDEEDPEYGETKMRIKAGRLMGVTLVAKPAFQECTIELEPEGELVPMEDGMYSSEAEVEPIVASVGIAKNIPVEPPSVWFDRPVLNGPTPITVTDEGQVFGHVATWDVTHIGLPNATRAPRSASNYAYFHTGVLRTGEGHDVKVGQLTLAGGHADLFADAAAAVRHYDDTGSAIADVHAGEDSYGIWVAGALRPGTTPEQVRAFRASAPSGDWRNINGRLELVAVCQVNVPGFPVTRSQLTAGAMVSLVAAGAETLARMKHSPEGELAERVRRLEEHERAQERRRAEAAIAAVRAVHPKQDLAALAAAARTRVYNVLDVDGYLSEFKDFSPQKRDNLAKQGHALKDGSFPIENVADLRRAIKAYGRTTDDKKAQVRRHIVKRARALGKPDLVPKDWSENSITDDALRARDAREVLTAAALERRVSELRKRVQG